MKERLLFCPMVLNVHTKQTIANKIVILKLYYMENVKFLRHSFFCKRGIPNENLPAHDGLKKTKNKPISNVNW